MIYEYNEDTINRLDRVDKYFMRIEHRLDIQWIGLRENLQETMVFTIKYRAFL